MKKFFAFLSIAALVIATAACSKPSNGNNDTPGGSNLPSAAGINPVVAVDGNVVTFSLPEGVTGLIPIWQTNETGEFVFAGTGNGFQKTFFDAGTFKVRMYVSNSAGQSADYTEAEFTVKGQEGWNGYNYNSQYNIWKVGEDAGMDKSYTWHSPGWSGEINLPFTINPYTLTINNACNGQWQAQLHLVPGADVALSSDKHYDFSCLVTVNKLCGGVTFKLTDTSSDDNFLFVEVEDMQEGTNIFYMKDVPGIDAAAVKMVFDFGWAAEGTEVSISRITLKDHANDDGTNAPDKVTPEPEPEPEPEPGTEVDPSFVFDVNGSANLWKAVADANGEKYFYYNCTGSEWNGVITESTEVPFLTKNGNSYVINYEANSGSEWQNQLFIFTQEGHFVPLDAAKKYALRLTLNANVNMKAFFKIAKYADKSADASANEEAKMKHEGETIWEWGRKDLTANEDMVITAPVISEIGCENINFIFDFGGNPANTVITIKDICLQEYNK